jgi:carboxypeptidase family protein
VRALALAAVTAFALGCGSAGGGTASGLRGLVERGPITPVCRVGQPCDGPAQGVKLLFSRAGKVAATATTNSKGWYRVTLRPGRYSVRTNLRRFGTKPQPANVTVPNGRVARRDFFIDTGIR